MIPVDFTSSSYSIRECLLLASLLFVVACDRESSAPQRDSIDYNVLLISIDTLRADHLGVYGYEKNTSPNIDGFAQDSILFETAIAQAPSTLPSHASIFTGMIPVNHGSFAAHQTPIAAELTTLPEVMRSAGFRTISFNGGGLVRGRYGFDRGFENYVTDRDNDILEAKVDEAIEWLDENGDEKFFMFLHTYEVHDPYQPRPGYLELFESDYAGDIGNDIGVKLLAEINSGRRSIDSADLEHIKNAYDAEIRSMDDAFERLLVYLKERGLYDDTIIVLTSDHGEEFGEHGGVGRHFYTLYDELLKVPFILKMPGSQLAGTVVKDQVRGIDIMPTLLDLVAINFEADLDGTSLVPFIFGEGTESLIAISQQDNREVLPPTSIRSADSKLILRPRVIEGIERSYRWYGERAVFETDTGTLTLPMAGGRDGEQVVVKMDGAARMKQRITLTTERQNYFVVVNIGGQQGDANAVEESAKDQDSGMRTIIVEAVDPCSTDEPDCVRFRVFDPQEFYALDEDPAELVNRYGEGDHEDDIEWLRSWLAKELADKPAVNAETIELDEETKRQLKSLGYLN